MPKQKYWDGTQWVELGVSANKVTLTDSGSLITATDVEGALQEIVTAFNKEKADYTLQPANGGTTGGTSTAYTCSSDPAPTVLTDKIGVVITVHTDSGANPTLNWNALGAKSIMKPNGNAAILKSGGIYTLRYNATSGNFILQGEGVSGDALASDLYSGKTASTDAGDIIGSNPFRVGSTVHEGNLRLTTEIGTQIWTSTINGDSIDKRGIVVDNSDNSTLVTYSLTTDSHKKVIKFDDSGDVVWSVVSADLKYPYGITMGSNGVAYVICNTTSGKLVSISNLGNVTVLSTGNNGKKVAVDPNGNLVVVWDTTSGKMIQKLTSGGSEIWNVADVLNPRQLWVDSSGNIYTGHVNGTIRKLNSGGTQLWANTDVTSALDGDIAIDSKGDIYTTTGSAIRKINSSGVQVWSITLETNYACYTLKIGASDYLYCGCYYNYGSYIGENLRKYSSSGTKTWSKTNIESTFAITLDAQENIVGAFYIWSNHVKKLSNNVYTLL